MNMFVKKLFIPGIYDDAFIYMQKLILLNPEGELSWLNLEREIWSTLDKLDKQYKYVGTMFFLRNDWLAGDQFRNLWQNVQIKKTILAEFNSFPSLIELNKKSLRKLTNTNLSNILDINIYNRRLYLASSNGLFHVDFEWTAHDIQPSSKVIKRHDVPCNQVNTKFGSVHLSCGNNGLFSLFDEFERLGIEKPKWQEVQQKSFRSSWLSGDLVNYSSPTSAEIFPVIRSNSSHAITDENSEKVATSFGNYTQKLEDILEQVTSTNIAKDDLVFLTNLKQAFYAQNLDSDFYKIPVKQNPSLNLGQWVLQGKQTKRISNKFNEKILDAVICQDELVLELFGNVGIVHKDNIEYILHEEVLSLKSYPYSKRFKNVLTAVVDEGVYIITLFNDSIL